MLGRQNKRDKLKEYTVNASELARQLAQDKRFRKRLLDAIGHSADVHRRARHHSGLAGKARRLAADQELRAELRNARKDLEHAYARLEAKKRGGRRAKQFTLLSGAALLTAAPRVRQRIGALIALRAPRSREQLRKSTRDRSPSPVNLHARSQPLEDMTKEELYARAQASDIPGRSEMSKAELLAALRDLA